MRLVRLSTLQGHALGDTQLSTTVVVPAEAVRRGAVEKVAGECAGEGAVSVALGEDAPLPPLAGDEAVVTLAGPFAALHAAVALLVRRTCLGGGGGDDSAGATAVVVKLVVSNMEAAEIIGPGGCFVNSMRAILGAGQHAIKVGPKVKENPDVRFVTLAAPLAVCLKVVSPLPSCRHRTNKNTPLPPTHTHT